MNDTSVQDDTRLPLTTPDPLAERAERLRELIPEAFVEGRVDFRSAAAGAGGPRQ
jgi:hypothetical protein